MTRKLAALVIGNSNYSQASVLKNPVNDAADVADKLETYGFNVIRCIDATVKQMDKYLKDFKTILADSEVGLFFFAGHGMQIDGKNYLLAVDTDIADETDAKHSSLSLDKVIERLEKSPVSTSIIILDACRDNPWARTWHRSAETRGLASVYAPKGTIIGFATSPGELASDGKGRNGTYTAALLQHIDEPDCNIETMFKQIRNTVAAETKGRQTSWEHTSLSGNFFFNLSLGRSVTEYSETSLADEMFVVDEAKPSHRVIKGLRSHNWYSQNDAIALLTCKSINKMNCDNLFVVGRNIYQSACGGSKDAMLFVRSFSTRTSGCNKYKRKAILDGILFEIFFDPKAKIRQKIKGNMFNDVFNLTKDKSLKSSFDFISEVLVKARGDFYVVPGRGHNLSVAVATSKRKDSYRIDAIYVDGENVLRQEGEEWSISDDDEIFYVRRSVSQLEEQLSHELMVPRGLLKISYTPAEAAAGELSFPDGYSVRKR